MNEPPIGDAPAPSVKADGETMVSQTFAGEHVAFTGTLASMTHARARELVAQRGGTSMAHVSGRTTILVIGEEGWPLELDGQPSHKLRTAQRLREQGAVIRLLQESDWLRAIGLYDTQHDIHRLYSPAVLSQMLDIPVGTIRAWERAGLIRPVQTVYRLPYFNFQEVTSARRLKELLDAGVSERTIRTSLESLRQFSPGIDRPLAQLDVLARDRRVLYRDHAGLVDSKRGQRLLDFDADSENTSEVESVSLKVHEVDASRLSAHDWFEQGVRLLAEGDAESSVEAFRLSLMRQPGDPQVNFYLAEACYRLGRLEAALERFYVTVEFDHEYIEAWTQMGCVHAEMNQWESARDAFRVALEIHPDCAEAHWHLAEALDQLGDRETAAEHWREYLTHDCRGPWAESARSRLEQIEP